MSGRWLLVRGRGGREALAEAVQAAGGRLFLAEVYQRRRPVFEAAAWMADWQAGGLDAVLVASGESLDNLVGAVSADGLDWLRRQNLVVPGERVAAQARELGFSRVTAAGGAGDAAMCRALLRLFGGSEMNSATCE